MITTENSTGILSVAAPKPRSIADHYPQSRKKYAGLVDTLKKALPGMIVDAAHIGGTAVEGLVGRSTVDVMLLVNDLYQFDQQSPLLRQLGFRSGNDGGATGHRRFHLGYGGNSDACLFVYEPGDKAALHHLLIRDYLRTNPKEKANFSELKSSLAERHITNVNNTNIKAYEAGKQPRLMRLLEQATGRR